jgi:hypothetical protein
MRKAMKEAVAFGLDATADDASRMVLVWPPIPPARRRTVC